MGIQRILITSQAALLVAGFSLSGCSGKQAYAVKGGGIALKDIDTTDIGGGLREAKLGCETDGEQDPDVIYRYYALTLGANSSIKEYCVAEGLEERFLAQPPESHRGKCPSQFCGQATTFRRGPVEHAAFQSVVSLEQSRSLKLSGSEQGSAFESSQIRANVHQDRVNFTWSTDTSCSAKFLIYNEAIDQDDGLSEADRLIAVDNQRRQKMNYFYNEGATLARGSIWYQQTKDNDQYKALLIIRSQFDGRYEKEFFEESILCTSKKGPITALDSTYYGFRFHKASAEEWAVYSAPLR